MLSRGKIHLITKIQFSCEKKKNLTIEELQDIKVETSVLGTLLLL